MSTSAASGVTVTTSQLMMLSTVMVGAEAFVGVRKVESECPPVGLTAGSVCLVPRAAQKQHGATLGLLEHKACRRREPPNCAGVRRK